MLILGHDLISKNMTFYFTRGIEGLKKDGISCFFYDEKIIEHVKKQGLDFAIFIQNRDEIFLANALEAKFLLFDANDKLAHFASKAAQFYLFDSKLLLIIENINTLQKAYNLKLDGVILKKFIQDYEPNHNPYLHS